MRYVLRTLDGVELSKGEVSNISWNEKDGGMGEARFLLELWDADKLSVFTLGQWVALQGDFGKHMP